MPSPDSHSTGPLTNGPGNKTSSDDAVPDSLYDTEKATDETEHTDQAPTQPPKDEKDVESGAGAPSDDVAGLGPAPEGGLRAWSVAIGCSFVAFACLGFANSFGVFQEYYITHQLADKSPDTVSWIGSCNAFFQFATAVFAGPLFDRYGEWVLRPAAIIAVFAVMMTSLAKEYYQILLAQGILMGIASGALQFPSMAAVSQYFDKKRAAAMGIAVAGSSIGGVVFPIALSRMLNGPQGVQSATTTTTSTSTDGGPGHLSFGWSVRVAGFVMLAVLSVAMVTVRPRLPPRTTHFFLWEAFRQKTFLLLIAAMFFVFLGMFLPLFYLPSFATSIGVDPTLASYMLAIVNAASTFGRIVPGIMADKLGRINALATGSIISGIVFMCMTSVTSTAGLVVYAVFAGFASGTIISGAATAISVCVPNVQEMGTYMGMGMGIGAIAVLIGPPINGHLLSHYGSFLQPAIFSGVMCIVGGVVALLAKTFTPAGTFGLI